MQKHHITVMLVAGMAGGCSLGSRPENLPGSEWQPAQGLASTCPPGSSVSSGQPPFIAQRLAPGDRVRLTLLGDVDRISGSYVVSPAGTIEIGGLPAQTIGGLELAQARQRLRQSLAAAGIIRNWHNALALHLVESAPVRVTVSGAVFASGIVSVGERSERQRATSADAIGDANGSRTLSAALRAAGGVRPDADINRIRVVRDGETMVFDLSGAMNGGGFSDTELGPGDRVIVASRNCFDSSLVRPSIITMGGIRLYFSNLTRPGASGGGVNKESGGLPYGTRFLQALTAVNCVGGSAMNARRRAVLISRNPLNGQSVVIERSVEALVRGAGRDREDPWLMPEDAVICYDSKMMSLQDAVGFVSSTAGIITPALLLRQAAQ